MVNIVERMLGGREEPAPVVNSEPINPVRLRSLANTEVDPKKRRVINRSASSQDNFRPIPREEPSFADRIGTAARGFGALTIGRGEEFFENRERQRQQKDMQLLQATVMDANSIQDAIRKENIPKAVDILVDRMNLLEKDGEDYEDTKMLRDALIGGRPDIVMSEIDTFLNNLPKQTIDPKFVTDQGQMISRSIGGPPTATTVSGYQGEAQDTIRPMTNAEMLQYRIPAGSAATINTRTGEPSILSSAESAAEYGTYTSDGIERYSDGPYAGYSLGRVAEMQRTGQLGKFGDPMPSMTPRAAAPAPEVRPPMRMTTPTATPDRYAGLSTQEAAIEQAKDEKERLDAERAAAEETRREEKALREKTIFEQEAEEAQRMQEAIKAEMLQVVGITNKLLNPSVYSDKVFEASTGALEGGNPLSGATFTLGADYQDVTNFTNDISYLQDLSTLENLGRMTGVLSESDIMLLRQAATGINLKSDANELKLKLRDLNDKIVEKLGGMGLSAEEIQGSSMQYSGGALDEAIDRINSRQRRRGPR